MTTYWVSTAKHYCKVCKIWIAGHQRNIRAHNGSKWHLDKEKQMLKEAEEKMHEKVKEEKQTEKMLKEMELAANRAMGIYDPELDDPGLCPPANELDNTKRYESTLVNRNLITTGEKGKGRAGGGKGNIKGTKGHLVPGAGTSTGGGSSSSSSAAVATGIGGPELHPAIHDSLTRKHAELRRKLKDQWAVCVDQSEKELFFFNRKTQERSWDPPKGLTRDDFAKELKKPLLWVEMEPEEDDAAARVYFYNTQTGDTQWTKPENVYASLPGVPVGWELVEEAEESKFAKKLDAAKMAERERREREAKKPKIDSSELSAVAQLGIKKTVTQIDRVAEMRDAARKEGIFGSEDLKVKAPVLTSGSLFGGGKKREDSDDDPDRKVGFTTTSKKKIRGGGNKRARVVDSD